MLDKLISLDYPWYVSASQQTNKNYNDYNDIIEYKKWLCTEQICQTMKEMPCEVEVEAPTRLQCIFPFWEVFFNIIDSPRPRGLRAPGNISAFDRRVHLDIWLHIHLNYWAYLQILSFERLKWRSKISNGQRGYRDSRIPNWEPTRLFLTHSIADWGGKCK